MSLQHCANCDGRHPPPLDRRCPFPAYEPPAPKRTTRTTRRSPSLSPPPPPKRGRGQPRTSRSPSLTPPPPPPPTKRGRGRPVGSKGKKKAPPRRQRPEVFFDAQDQPESPHRSICVTPRDSGRQPPPSTQPADPQLAAIQAIADQLARMQQEARDYQAAAARDREADRQEMLRRTAATQPAPGPSHPDAALTGPPPSESLRATASQPTPGPSQEDPSLSRYRQLLADNPPLTAQWPHKKVWLAKTRHWAEYDHLTVEQFVQGYIEIVLPTIPQGPATQIARDHIRYLQQMMRDTSSAPWHLIRSTHKQILLMVEHKQLKWENAAARDTIRAAQLLIAKEEAIQAKLSNLPAKSTNTGNKPQPKEAKPCQSFNNGTCTHLKDHDIDGTRFLHVCSQCFKHRKQRHRHQVSACHKKGGKA